MKKVTLSLSEVSAVCLELSMFFHAGADAGSALSLLAEETDISSVKDTFRAMSARIDDGASLSEAVRESGIFPNDVSKMIEVGEKTGRCEEALRSLSDYYAKKDEMDHHLRGALLYPSILLGVMLTVIVVLLTKILPIFNNVYSSLGGRMTGIAGGLLHFGEMLGAILPVFFVIMAAAAVFLIVFSSVENVRNALLRFFAKHRTDRGTAKKMADARFAEALSMAICSGMTSYEAVYSAAQIFDDNEKAKQKCDSCLSLLENGESLAAALRESGLLPPSECRLLALGTASGNAEDVSHEIADRLNRSAIDSLERLVGLVEPIMVIFTSLLVGAILLTVMLPLTEIMTAIG